MNLQEELKALKKRIAELEEQAKEEQEFPQKFDDYWYIDVGVEVDVKKTYYNHYVDECRQEIGNIFRTKEQAEFAVEKLKVEAELRKFSKTFELWESNYLIALDTRSGELDIKNMTIFNMQGAIHFESKAKAQQAIDTIGAQRIKKYIFGVE